MSNSESLEKFIGKHSKLIEVIGVFGALTAFFVQSNTGYVSIVTMFIFTMLSAELVTISLKEIPFKLKTPVNMMTFTIIFLALFSTVTLYFLNMLAKNAFYFMIFVVTSSFGLMSYYNFKIYQKYLKIGNKKKVFIGLMLITIITFVIEGGLLYSTDVLNWIRTILSW